MLRKIKMTSCIYTQRGNYAKYKEYCQYEECQSTCTIPDLSDANLGTVDAVMRLSAVTEEAVGCGGVLLAVSLEIANALSSLPLCCIREALHYYAVPEYLNVPRVRGPKGFVETATHGDAGACSQTTPVKRGSKWTPHATYLNPSETLQIARLSTVETSRDGEEGEWKIARKNRIR